jgi:hypothetical protein
MKSFGIKLVLCVIVSLALILLISADLCTAQGVSTQAQVAPFSIQKLPAGLQKPPQRKSHDRAKGLADNLMQYKLNKPVSGNHTVTVYPDGIGFDNIEEAFDFCSQNRLGGKARSRIINYILLRPGIYTGPFTLPPDSVVIGEAGRNVTFIVAPQGTNEPTLKATPPGGTTETEYGLSGLSVIGRAVAAISFTGPNAASGLWIDNCSITTLSPQAIPAVVFSGDAPYGTETGMFISKSIVESELGIGVEVVCGNGADFGIHNSDIEGQLSAVDIQGNSSGRSDVGISGSELESDSPSQPILRVDGVEFCRIKNCTIGDDEIAGVNVVSLSRMSYGLLDRSRIWCENAVGVKVDQVGWFEMNYTHIGGLRGAPLTTVGLDLTNANAYLYYTRIDATQDVVKDPNSSYTLTYCD